ncbi:MAG: hypothetical protein M0Q02_13795, partial [Candidatus Muirbacterium halophilum]|nr:hypothetical protein [Candidatus Muirbacterium halophilum]
IIPSNISEISYIEKPLDELKKSYIKNVKSNFKNLDITIPENKKFLMDELNIKDFEKLKNMFMEA